MNQKEKYYNLYPSSTAQNIIFLVIALHEVSHLENVGFYTEKGEMIQNLSLNTDRYVYTLLSTIQVNKKMEQETYFDARHKY